MNSSFRTVSVVGDGIAVEIVPEGSVQRRLLVHVPVGVVFLAFTGAAAGAASAITAVSGQSYVIARHQIVYAVSPAGAALARLSYHVSDMISDTMSHPEVR